MTLARLKRRLEKAEKRLSELNNHIGTLTQEWREVDNEIRRLRYKIDQQESIHREFVNTFKP